MKKLTLIFLLIIFAQISTAQFVTSLTTVDHQPAKVIFVFTGSIIADAIGDALCDNGHKVPGHSLQALSIAFLLPLPYLLDLKPYTFGWYLTSYLCLRVGLFDPVYNLTRGLPLGYVGRTSVYDNTIRKFDPPSSMLLAGRVLVFSVGIKIPIDHL